MAKSKLRVIETITITTEIDVTEDTFPGMSAQEAAEHERKQELGDNIERFGEALEYAIFDVDAYRENEGKAPNPAAGYMKTVSIINE